MKVGVVIAGYAAAILAAVVAGWLYNRAAAAQPYDTSGGMYAAGEAMASLGAFFLVALVPTLLALWFLRAHQGFWNCVAFGALAFASVGLVAVVRPLLFPTTGPHFGPMIMELVRLSQLLGVPLWAGGFAVCAVLAPSRASRLTLVAATVIEAVIALCAVVHWFVLRPPL
jgi:hypothetical protein